MFFWKKKKKPNDYSNYITLGVFVFVSIIFFLSVALQFEKINRLQAKISQLDGRNEVAQQAEYIQQAQSLHVDILSTITTASHLSLEAILSNPTELVQNYEEPQFVGSGFFVDSSQGLIATNKHVIPTNYADYSVELSDGAKVPARKVYEDPLYDIAFLQITESPFSFELPGTENVFLGEQLTHIGEGAELQFSKTLDINTHLQENLSELITVDIKIHPGDSGGMVINNRGEVTGMNVAFSQISDGKSYLIPTKHIKTALQNYKISLQ